MSDRTRKINFHRLFIFTMAGMLFSLALVYYFKNKAEHRILLDQKILSQQENENFKYQVENLFLNIYRLLKATTHIPGISEYANGQSQVPAKSSIFMFQEIFNLIQENISVSEIHIVGSEFDITKFKKAGYLARPILTFNSQDENHMAHSNYISKIEDVDHFEFMEISEQVRNFKQLIISKTFDPYSPPLLVSNPITISEEIDKENTSTTRGVVMSIPIYDNSGHFSGLISSMFSDRVLRNLLYSRKAALINADTNKVLFTFENKSEIKFNNYQKIPLHLPFIINNHWVLMLPDMKSTNSILSEDLKNIQLTANLMTTSIILAGIFILLIFYQINRTDEYLRGEKIRLEKEVSTSFETLKLEKAKSIHNAKLASLGEMAAGIAHEINNPLSIVSGSIYLLKKYRDNPDKFDEKIVSMQKSCNRIEKIVKGLKKFSRSSENGTFKKIQLLHIINEVLILVDTNSKRYSVPIFVNIPENIYIECDEIEIEQVLINLINNAIDAIINNNEKWIKITAQIEEAEAIINVMDSGKGIAPEIENRIFEPFFTTKEVGKGTGLGLSISKGILESHNATLKINKNVEHTCFEIRFKKV